MPNRRIEITEFGAPEVLRVVTDPAPPEPGPGQVRLKVLASGVAFTDVMIRTGQYPDVTETPPFTPGYDVVGVVDALGPGAERFDLGERVADLTTIGAHADYVCLPEARLTRVPDGVDTVAAAAAILSYVTAWQMLHRIAKLEADQSLLIHGAGGAVGSAMLELAALAGVRAYGTDLPEKHDLIRDRGGVPIDSAAEGLEDRLKAAVGEGVDAAFDPIGGESFARSFHVLKPGGMLVAFGFYDSVLGRGGSIPLDFVKLKLWDLFPNGHATVFYSIGALRRRHPGWFEADLAEVFDLLADDRIHPEVARVLPLESAAEAHRLIEGGHVAGKIVLVTDA